MVSNSESARTRGRPRDPAKREALLDAARKLFMRGGVETVTMDDVVAAAGVARGTLYAYFPDKAALFEAMIARESERVIADDWAGKQHDRDPVSALISFGESLLAFLYDPERMSFERVAEGAAREQPELASRLYEVGPAKARAALRGLIVAGQKQGLIRRCDLDAAISDLSGLWQGFLRVELTFHQRPHPTSSELRRRSEHGVRQFLRLYGARTKAGSKAAPKK